MKVFISWSGRRSHHMAEVLRDWLPKVLQAVTPWMSERDIEAGDVWYHQLSSQLRESNFGILCLTPENLQSNWLHFEAGALALSFGKRTHVIPYLVGLNPEQVAGPFTQFQALNANKAGTEKLVKTINNALGKRKLSPNYLDDVFNKFWPDLDRAIRALREPPSFRRVDENQLVQSETKALLTRAYNLSLDPELGPFDIRLRTFNKRLAYLMETVVSNLEKGRPYQYILGPKPWKPYEVWVKETIQQIQMYYDTLQSKDLANRADLVTLSLLRVPAPIEFSIDIHTLNSEVSEDIVGFWCQEGPGARVPQQYVLEVRDSEALETIWSFLREIADEFGIEYTLSQAVNELSHLEEFLLNQYVVDPSESYLERANKIRDIVWDRIAREQQEVS